MPNLLGVILCGGESSRMGADKGSRQEGDSRWATIMSDKLSFLHIPLAFSVNECQLEIYGSFIRPDRLIADNNSLKGPLRGLLSVHHRFPAYDLLLLACDMLTLDRPTIEKLIAVYREESGYDFFVYQDLKYAQPFCGIYTSGGLTKSTKKIFGQGAKDFSLQSLLNEGLTRRLPIERMKAFANFNSPDSSPPPA